MASHAEGQQHPIAIYLWIWGLLFVLSALSYMVDYLQFQGYLRWSLIIIFMLLKAGLIVAVFMHMMWERMAIICANASRVSAESASFTRFASAPTRGRTSGSS